MRLLLLLLAATCATVATGLQASAAGAPRSTLTAGPSSFGRILFDGRGYALYGFTRDPRRRSALHRLLREGLAALPGHLARACESRQWREVTADRHDNACR